MRKHTIFSISLLLIVAMLFTTTCFAVKSAEAVGLGVPTYAKVDETSPELRNISTRVLAEYNEPTLHEDRTGYAKDLFVMLGGILLTVAGGFYAATAQNIFLACLATLGLSLVDVALDKTVEVELWSAYRIIVKEAQVNPGSGWQTYYTSKSREVYRWELSRWSDHDNLPRRALREFLPRDGYAPLGIQYAQHYTDHYMLAQIARERYVRAMGPATETWGYTPPLPDPQRVVAENS